MTEMDKKKQVRHNTTIKKRPDTSENVQNVLKLINSSNGYDNEDDSGLADFNPPPRAEVSTKTMGPNTQNAPQNAQGPNAAQNAQNAQNAEGPINIDYEKPTHIQHTNEENSAKAVNSRQYPIPLDSYEGFKTSLPKTYASDYYKQYVPYFNQSGSNDGQLNKNQLLEKLNYMIHLLEEQKDEKTGHVMEEVILYSFLGVFIIFIVDSFARVGKYTR